MIKFSPIILAFLFAIVSCVPMSRTSGISYHPDIRNKFNDESERILVLPIWEIYPLFSDERQEETFAFGKPIFSTVKELPDLYQIIPTKISVSLMGMSFAIGRLIFIDAIKRC